MSIIEYGFLLDSGGGITFYSLEQATDYYQGTLTSHTILSPATIKYKRPAAVAAKYAIANIKDITLNDLQRKHIVSRAHVEAAATSIVTLVNKTVQSRHNRNKFKDKSGGCGCELFRWLQKEVVRLMTDEDAAEAVEAAVRSSPPERRSRDGAEAVVAALCS